MPVPRALRRALVIAPAVTVLAVALAPSTAAAHSLTSSTIAVRVQEDSVDATVSLPLKTLDEALGTDYASDVELAAGEADDVDRLHRRAPDGHGRRRDHLGRDATTTSSARRSRASTRSASTSTSPPATRARSRFTVAYDGIIEAVPGHEAVVVLTDSAGEISTAGVVDADHETPRGRRRRAGDPGRRHGALRLPPRPRGRRPPPVPAGAAAARTAGRGRRALAARRRTRVHGEGRPARGDRVHARALAHADRRRRSAGSRSPAGRSRCSSLRRSAWRPSTPSGRWRRAAR